MYSYSIIQYYSNKITPIPLYIQLKQLVENIFQGCALSHFPHYNPCGL